jgi:ABC-type nitrate/sulfonate/bicarbonate transport system substrate-binding protein
MKHQRKLIPALLAAVLGIGALSGGSAAASANPQNVDLKGFKLVVADTAGIFKAVCAQYNCTAGAKYTIEFVTFATGPEALAATVGGSVHLAGTAMAPAVFAAAANQPAKIVAVTEPQSKPGNSFAIVVSKKSYDAGLTTIAALRGKQLSLTTGTEGELLAINALKKARVPLTSVSFSNLGPAANFAAITSGAVAAAVLPEPFVSMSKAAGAQVLTTGTGYLPGYFAFFQSNKTLKNPKVVAAITDYLKRWQKMTKQIYADSATGVAVYAKTLFPALPLAAASPLASVLYENSRAGFVPIEPKVILEFQKVAQTLFDVGALKKPVDMSKFFDAKVYYATLKALPKVK